MVKAEDPIVTVKVDGIDELSAIRQRREAVPLREFCVELSDASAERGVMAETVAAHRFRFDSGFVSFSFIPEGVKGGANWLRFLVDRDGREDIVAAFREVNVRAVWEIAKEES